MVKNSLKQSDLSCNSREGRIFPKIAPPALPTLLLRSGLSLLRSREEVGGRIYKGKLNKHCLKGRRQEFTKEKRRRRGRRHRLFLVLAPP